MNESKILHEVGGGDEGILRQTEPIPLFPCIVGLCG